MKKQVLKNSPKKRIPGLLEKNADIRSIQGYLHGKADSNIIAAPAERSMRFWPMSLGR